ncbi:unnamed protein product [Spodoptera littoralis]|uniref:Uncharacterized protein n=1 Tax=Spodoptera littoralis TaxID=7109 RepID=A0A9P0IAC2_SPOLI|nr:unnamed protein product [Spodoptera littoralis]CAH1642255.1 unnamed protein product [Spodoptera littoralis]
MDSTTSDQTEMCSTISKVLELPKDHIFAVPALPSIKRSRQKQINKSQAAEESRGDNTKVLESPKEHIFAVPALPPIKRNVRQKRINKSQAGEESHSATTSTCGEERLTFEEYRRNGERLKELDMAYEGAMDLLRILDEDGVNRRKGRSKRKTDMQNEVDMAYEGAMQLIANGNNSHIASRVGNAGPSNGGAEVGPGTRHTSAIPTKPTPQSKGNLVAHNAANASPLMPHPRRGA